MSLCFRDDLFVCEDYYSYRTIGVSNRIATHLQVMFYDYEFYDLEDGEKPRFIDIPEEDLFSILREFDHDCLLFQTSKGFHFVSLSFDTRYLTPIERVDRLSKELEQDYRCDKEFDNLILRIGPKICRKTGEIYKEAPKFLEVLKYPNRKAMVCEQLLRAFSINGLSDKIIKMYYKKATVNTLHNIKLLYYLTPR